MSEVIQNLAGKLEFGDPVVKGNLVLFPLFTAVKGETVPYLLLEEAIKTGGLVIEEVNGDGRVNTIVMANHTGQAVLLLDGDEILGAKQNRIINATILVAAGERVEVPVSCVERGRWSDRAARFDRVGEFGYSTLRKQKAEVIACCLKRVQRFDADQHAIWDEIERKQDRMAAPSATGALHEVYRKTGDELKSMIGRLEPAEGQTGVAVFINNRFVCLDLFDRPETLPKIWEKLLRSYAMEALEEKAEKSVSPPVDIKKILDSISSAECAVYPSVGLGHDLRLSGAGIIGAALALNNRLIHLSVFNDEN